MSEAATIEAETLPDGRVALFRTVRQRVGIFDDPDLAGRVADMLGGAPWTEPEPQPTTRPPAPVKEPWHGVTPPPAAERWVPPAPVTADFHPAAEPEIVEPAQPVGPISSVPVGDPDEAYKARLMEALEEAKLGAPPMMLAEKYDVSAKALGGKIGLWKRRHATAAEIAAFERGRDMHQLANLEGRK